MATAPHPSSFATGQAAAAWRFSPESAMLPRPSNWLFRHFRAYARRYLGRHFHAVRLSRAGTIPSDLPGPLIVALNHPSWWDPLVGLVLTALLEGRVHYAPIEAAGLDQYPFLGRLGFFGVDPHTPRGRLTFVRRARAILARPESVLWITPQGKFVDPRERPTHIRQGVGHLVHRLHGAIVVPLALEYPLWNDRCPEALAHFGPPIRVEDGREASPSAWTARIAQALEQAQDALAAEAIRRDADAFSTIIGGTAGVGGVYDLWRRLRAAIRGERFTAEHALARGSTASEGSPSETVPGPRCSSR